MNKKIGRNEPCPCGSGKKYKKCCINKEMARNKMPEVSISQICDLVKNGLKQKSLHSNSGTEKFRIKSVKLMNNNMILCEFYPYSKSTMDIKTEIGYIMSFLYSFFNNNEFVPSEIQNFGVRAYFKSEEEVMYAISSKETCKYISEGKPIEWLKNTIFQDNSDDFRMTQAKSKISEIENSLRKVVCRILSGNNGISWWNTYIDNKIKKSAENAFKNQKGITSNSGEELIHFTYLLNLKDIISNNWNYFISIFKDETDFNQKIDELNIIRRDEAHNRNISSEQIKKLNIIYSDLMDSIPKKFTEIGQRYLVDNWRIQLSNIVNEYSKKQNQFFPTKERYSLHEAVVNILFIINQLNNITTKLMSIVVPPGKTDLHEKLITLFSNMKNSFEEMMLYLKNGDLKGVEEAAMKNQSVNNQLADYTEKYLMSEL